MAIAYVSGGINEIDLARRLAELRQFVQSDQDPLPHDKVKSDLTVQFETTTVLKDSRSLLSHDTEKDDLGLTRVQESQAPGFPNPIETEDSNLAFNNPVDAVGTPNGFNPADTPVQEVETVGSRSEPILRIDAASGLLSIGNFKTLTVSGPQHTCAAFASTMLGDLGASPHKLSVEINNSQISIYKICAVNGSVIITCRGSKIVVSPRQPRPDDQCVRAQ